MSKKHLVPQKILKITTQQREALLDGTVELRNLWNILKYGIYEILEYLETRNIWNILKHGICVRF